MIWLTTVNAADSNAANQFRTGSGLFWVFLSRRKRQAADNQIERVETAARTYPTEVPSIRWDGMFKTGVLLIWVSEENKNNVR